jgi:hypothetical protein
VIFITGKNILLPMKETGDVYMVAVEPGEISHVKDENK